ARQVVGGVGARRRRRERTHPPWRRKLRRTGRSVQNAGDVAARVLQGQGRGDGPDVRTSVQACGFSQEIRASLQPIPSVKDVIRRPDPFLLVAVPWPPVWCPYAFCSTQAAPNTSLIRRLMSALLSLVR